MICTVHEGRGVVCASGVVFYGGRAWTREACRSEIEMRGARHDGTQFDVQRGTRVPPSALLSLAMAHHTVANNFSNTTGAPILVNSQLVQERDNRWLDGGNVRRSRNKSSF